MDPSKLRKRVLLNLATSPWVLLPTVAGLSLLLLTGVLPQGMEYLVLGGVGGVLTGIGALATRWVYGSDELTRQALEELRAEALAEEEKAIDALAQRLLTDDDPRTEVHLQKLRSLYRDFRADTAWTTRVSPFVAVEIAQNVDSLYKGCVRSLERSLEFWQTAKKMTTSEARKKILDARERILDDIAGSIDQLARTLDEVRTLGVKVDAGEDLAHLREELGASLTVARRVEERMQELDAEIERRLVIPQRQ